MKSLNLYNLHTDPEQLLWHDEMRSKAGLAYYHIMESLKLVRHGHGDRDNVEIMFDREMTPYNRNMAPDLQVLIEKEMLKLGEVDSRNIGWYMARWAEVVRNKRWKEAESYIFNSWMSEDYQAWLLDTFDIYVDRHDY